MKTQFENLNQLKKGVTIGQPIYLENHSNPHRSRVTKIKNLLSYFFTVENVDGKESWIINGATNLKEYAFTFEPEYERVNIFFKANNMPFLTIHFNDTIIKGKQ